MDLRESIRRVHESEADFGRAFYKELLERCPELARFFDGLDMNRQATIFTMQLAVVAAYAEAHAPSAEQYLQILGTQHHRRGIPRERYSDFRDCLLAMLEQFHGQEWSERLENRWRNAMDGAIGKMWEGYDQKFHV